MSTSQNISLHLQRITIMWNTAVTDPSQKHLCLVRGAANGNALTHYQDNQTKGHTDSGLRITLGS